MAPRTAKGKKAADVKVAENAAPKKGRGKANIIDEPEAETVEAEVIEKAPLAEKKTKRGKKAPAVQELKNGSEDSESVKSNNMTEEDSASNGDSELNGDHTDANGHSEESQNSTDKVVKVKSTGKGRGRKAKPKVESEPEPEKKTDTTENDKEKEVKEEKPKALGKGRGRKVQIKEDLKEKTDSVEEEEEKAEAPVSKKRGQNKAPKEKPIESDKEETHENQKEEEEEKSVEEEPVKRKGRKGVGKKANAKEPEEKVKEAEPAAKKRKVTKKEAKGDSKDVEDVEEENPKAKPVRGKRGQNKAAEPSIENEKETQDTGESATKRRRKPADDKAPLLNKAETDYESIDFSNTSKSIQGKEWNYKIASWNVDGIRAWLRKGGLDYINYEKPDILCLQETKCSQDKMPEEVKNLPGYHAYWLCSEKDGYAGVGIYTAKLAINVQYGLQNEELDSEGRIITAEYEQFYLICTYVPNAGRQLITLPKRLQWNEEFRKHVKELDKKKPVIICGDMNVAHKEIDLANPSRNKKNAGFTEEERAGMTDLLGDGFVDTYRHLYPDKTSAYTFWTYMMNSRAKNVGWRLDYFIVSERLLPSLCDNVIRDKVYGSDHCPISLFLHLSSADKPKE